MLLNQALAPKNFNFSRSQALRSWTCGQLLVGQLGQLPPLKLTNSHLKIGQNKTPPIGNETIVFQLPTYPFFRCKLAVSFREGSMGW